MTSPIAKLSFWGVRGSTPTVDPATWRFGGNTPCLELIAPDGTQLILDCGTGLRTLGSRWGAGDSARPPEAHIFVTHYHWDHIQGLPFFSPLYVEKNEFQFYSFRSKFLGRDSLRQVFETQMALPYFPVDFSAMNARRKFREVEGGENFCVGSSKVTARWLRMRLTMNPAIRSWTEVCGNWRRAPTFSSTTRNSLQRSLRPRAKDGAIRPGRKG
jgi:phosphoribosyl 1,2-cyclic phosphodiesterase